jgi:hypothetical protein
MKKIKVAVLNVLIILSSLNVMAQGAEANAGNGGDVAFCSEAQEINDLVGAFALDYLRGKKTYGTHDPEYVSPSFFGSMERILSNLKLKVPELGNSLEEFMRFVENTYDFTQERVWTPSQLPLTPIFDEGLRVNLPENCQNVVQAIVRSGTGPIEYLFDEKTLGVLSGLQLSFLYIHEWLRDFTDDPVTIVKVNWLLHSKRIESLSSEQLVAELKGRKLGSFTTFSEYKSKEQAKREREEKYQAWLQRQQEELVQAKEKNLKEIDRLIAELDAIGVCDADFFEGEDYVSKFLAEAKFELCYLRVWDAHSESRRFVSLEAEFQKPEIKRIFLGSSLTSLITNDGPSWIRNMFKRNIKREEPVKTYKTAVKDLNGVLNSLRDGLEELRDQLSNMLE